MKFTLLIASGLFMAFAQVDTSKILSPAPLDVTCVTESLTCEDDPIVMRGHVRNIAGNPLSGVTVTLTLSGNSTPEHSTSTDSQGEYVFPEVCPNSYVLKLAKSGYVTKNIPLDLQVNTERTDTLIAQ
jgi:hypothetical protein